MEAARKAEVDRAKAEAMATETIAAARESIQTHREATSDPQIAQRAWELVATRQRETVYTGDRDTRWQTSNDMAVQFQRDAGTDVAVRKLTGAEETEVGNLCKVFELLLGIIIECILPEETPSAEEEAMSCMLCEDEWKDASPRIPPVYLRTKHCKNSQ